MSKTTILHMQHVFKYISLVPAQLRREMTKFLSWLENGNGKAINFTLSPWFELGRGSLASVLTQPP